MCGNQFVSKKPLESSMIIITTGEEEGWMGSDDYVISQFQSEGVFHKGRDERERERENVCVVTVFH